ncbi:hypothetical protein HanXRQr2_Chr01g0002381 [Helianthus annuus]|uniref:Uncharacterized protein n=1 Tax=Helianthus annuus TaxID=4232 RepID=A0A251VMS2_HELAN|nr:hypothetical protein HanXRQr2_Chr01g0002381 [Helianthus annuus]KAJ0610277.1 hypothetical protein HanHA300_Chr01g0002031 [Helianthus annuus]KAJ0620908.1 hypothetical protein HanIR_Chr01g0002711 [Helianthus annuus]KAJ0625491.1 hypothetical protein HanHA89_Chr01g0002251 [Helianthus annuus]KAJ0781888.1 hypothetical protein HanLR1_Chr01g0001931 [Helianthus annuus]
MDLLLFSKTLDRASIYVLPLIHTPFWFLFEQASGIFGGHDDRKWWWWSPEKSDMMLWWFHTTVSPPLLCQSIGFNPNLFFSRLQGFSLHQFLTHLHRIQG